MVITNIKSLLGIRAETALLRGGQLAELPALDNAYLRIEGDRIADYGPMANFVPLGPRELQYSAAGRYVLPAWCDSHTHLVFAGSREGEFVDKIKGASYAEIAAKGGGILHSAARLNDTEEEVLFAQAWERLQAVQRMGTGAIEIKSGYGLTLEGELKMLRVIRRLKAVSDMPIKATLLAAHAYPAAYKEDHAGYINLIIREMLPRVAEEGLADYIDVFCEAGFFSVAETAQILEAGARYGLRPKIHANQLHCSGGVQIGVQHGAVSVDHLECVGADEIACLQGKDTVATLLPTAAFFLRLPYPPARQMLDANVAIALATDYNPGSSPSGNVPLLIALSCIQMRLTPEEAINAATTNGAFAMQLQHDVGSIAIGKRANLIVTKPMPSLAYWPYSFGENLIEQVLLNGAFLTGFPSNLPSF